MNFLVCGSMPDMTVDLLADTSSNSARLAKPLFLAIASACASTFGSSGLSGSALDRHHIVVGAHEALNVLLSELDLLVLLGGSHARIKQSES